MWAAVRLVIDLGADPCVFIEVTPEEQDQLIRESAAWRGSGFFSPLMERAEHYSRIVAQAILGDLLPDDWNTSRTLADETRLHGTVHGQIFGVTLRTTV